MSISHEEEFKDYAMNYLNGTGATAERPIAQLMITLMPSGHIEIMKVGDVSKLLGYFKQAA